MRTNWPSSRVPAPQFASRNKREVNALPVMAGPKTVGALVDKYLASAK
jgi:hypothetical protein